MMIKVAHFTLCYSGKTFASIYPNETQEMVFDAHGWSGRTACEKVHQRRNNWQHYLPLLAHKRGSLKNDSPFMHMSLPEELLIIQKHLQQRPQRVKRLCSYLILYPVRDHRICYKCL